MKEEKGIEFQLAIASTELHVELAKLKTIGMPEEERKSLIVGVPVAVLEKLLELTKSIMDIKSEKLEKK